MHGQQNIKMFFVTSCRLAIVLTKPTQPPAHTRSEVAAGSDKLHLSDKIITLTAINSANYVHKKL
jgi:hypothetical protein